MSSPRPRSGRLNVAEPFTAEDQAVLDALQLVGGPLPPIHRQLAAARRKAGWTQVQLAEILRYADANSIHRWEAGSRAVPRSVQARLRAVLQVPLLERW